MDGGGDRDAVHGAACAAQVGVRGPRWLPALGRCSLEPLAGGWLVRAEDEPAPRVPARGSCWTWAGRAAFVRVSDGAGAWSRELSPRHAELLYLLAVHRAGRSAADLARDVFGDPARTVTVRAEMSRVRRYLGALLEHRPYRFTESAEVEVVLPDAPGPLPAYGVRSRGWCDGSRWDTEDLAGNRRAGGVDLSVGTCPRGPAREIAGSSSRPASGCRSIRGTGRPTCSTVNPRITGRSWLAREDVMKHRGRHRRRRRGRALRATLAGTALALTAAATMISTSQATDADDPGALKPLTAAADAAPLRLTEHAVPGAELRRLTASMGPAVGVGAVLADPDGALQDAASVRTTTGGRCPSSRP